MRLPYLQVAMEVLEQHAPDLAVILDRPESSAGWGLMKLFSWALGRCPDEAPPSVNAVVPGPAAARLVARAAQFDGDPEEFVTACESVRPEPILERVEGGIRVCGLGRYDAAWLKNQPKDLAAAWRAFLDKSGPDPRRAPSETAPEPGRNRDGIPPEPALQKKMQKKTHTQLKDSSPSGATAANPVTGLVAPPAIAQSQNIDRRGGGTTDPDEAMKFFAWTQRARLEKRPGLMEEYPPPDFLDWFARARARVKGDVAKLEAAWMGYLDGDFGAKKRPPYPMRVFEDPECWPQFVPEDVAPTRAAVCADCGATAEAEAWGKPYCYQHMPPAAEANSQPEVRP